MNKAQRVILTGATSFIGSEVARALLERGYEVFGIVRPGSTARSALPVHPRFHEVTADISDPDRWSGEIGNADIFYHFAWGGPGPVGRADVAIQTKNVLDTLQCLRTAAAMGVKRFIFSGSQAEYGQVRGIITEETPCNPILEYGKCKLKVRLQASELAASLGLCYIHTRIFSVYGPDDHPYTLVPSCIRTLLSSGKMELTSCEQMWNFLHVRDAADIFCVLADCPWEESDPVVNVAGDDTRVLRDYVEEIDRLTGKNGSCVYGARQGGERPVDNWPDITKLQRITGWKPRISFTRGIEELIEIEKKKR